MMGKTPPPPRRTTTSPPVSDSPLTTRRRRKRKTKGDDFCTDNDDGNDVYDDDFDDVYDDDKKGGFVDEITKRVKLCASITGRADDAKDDEDEDAFATVLASTSSYAEMNSVLKRVHFEAKERWERRRATRAEADGMK